MKTIILLSAWLALPVFGLAQVTNQTLESDYNPGGQSTTQILAKIDTNFSETLTGPVSSTDNALVRWDLATGRLVQDSGIIVDDSGNISGITSMAVTTATTATLQFEGSTDDEFETTLAVVDPTADRMITFPNLSGTVALRDATEVFTNKTLDGDNNTFSNLDLGNEVDWAAAADVADASAFESGDKMIIFEAGVGLRKIDRDDLPSGGATNVVEAASWPVSPSDDTIYLNSSNGDMRVYSGANYYEFAGTLTLASPTLSSATLGTDGVSLTLVFSENVTIGSGGSGGVTVDASVAGTGISGTYASGDGTSSFVYTLASTVDSGETVSLDYTQPSDGLEDDDGNDLASVSNAAVTNNSTQGGGGLSFIETFEDGTDYDNTPVATNGTPDSNYTTIVLSGSESLLLADSEYVIFDLGQEYSDVWIKFEIQMPIEYGGDFGLWLYDGTSYANNADVVAFIDWNTNANVDSNQGYTVGAGTEATTNVTPETSLYYIYCHYVASSGASDGVFDVWAETTETRSDPATNSTTDGDRTEGVRYVRLNSVGTDTIFDDLEASESAL